MRDGLFWLGAISVGLSLAFSCLIYMLPLKKRSCFAVRMAAVIVLGCALGVFLESREYRTMWSSVFVLGYYLFAVASFYICIDTKGFEPWYCGVWALMTHSFLAEAALLLEDALFENGGFWQRAGLEVLIMLSGYALIALTIARWMPQKGRYQVGPRQTASALMLCMVFEYLFFALYINGWNWIVNMFGQFYCITILYLQYALFKKSALEHELDTIRLLWHQQKEQYQVTKETIELINHKCHDLKHQMRAMRSLKDGEERENYLREIEESVQIYGSIVKTGNEILDVILTEKSLLCEREGIHVGCVADGDLLSFMDSVDLYTIFGNAVDNAIESVRRLEKKEKRLIDIMVYAKQRFLMIQIINPFDSELQFEDGLPMTTKKKNGYHGFGLKSIRHTIEKYGGFLTVETREGCFYLKMMIPLPDSL